MKGSNCDSNPEYKGVPLDSIDGIITGKFNYFGRTPSQGEVRIPTT